MLLAFTFEGYWAAPWANQIFLIKLTSVFLLRCAISKPSKVRLLALEAFIEAEDVHCEFLGLAVKLVVLVF